MWLDTLLDVLGIAWDVADIVKDPGSLLNWGALVADVACVFVPGVTGAGKAIKIGSKAGDISKAVKVAGKVDDFVDAIKSGLRIFGSYQDMQKVTKGFNNAIQAHHLISKYFARMFGWDINKTAAVVIDKALHSVFTQKWNSILRTIKQMGDY